MTMPVLVPDIVFLALHFAKSISTAGELFSTLVWAHITVATKQCIQAGLLTPLKQVVIT